MSKPDLGRIIAQTMAKPVEGRTIETITDEILDAKRTGGEAILTIGRCLIEAKEIPVPWYLVEPWQDTGGRIWYTVTHPLTGEPMKLPQEDVCHYKGSTRNGLKGISVLRRAADTLAEARAAQEYNRAFYENGGQPSGVLQTDSDLGGYMTGPDGKPLKQTDGSCLTKKDSLRADWEKIHAGPKSWWPLSWPTFRSWRRPGCSILGKVTVRSTTTGS